MSNSGPLPLHYEAQSPTPFSMFLIPPLSTFLKHKLPERAYLGEELLVGSLLLGVAHLVRIGNVIEGLLLRIGQTATNIKKTNKLLGLHFDNATGLDVNNFTDKTNRISFNLGESDRFLWFVNKSIEDIYNQALAEGYVPENEKDLCRYFLETNPDYPVIRLRIKPNEIYIAPTDYVLHDGSTADSSYRDVTFVVLGYFNPLALEKRYSSALESR